MTTHPNEKAGRKQADRILAYMREHGAVTPLDALLEIGCMRLGARIYDLKQAGHPIKARLVEVPTRAGRLARVAEYYIEQQSAAEGRNA